MYMYTYVNSEHYAWPGRLVTPFKNALNARGGACKFEKQKQVSYNKFQFMP